MINPPGNLWYPVPDNDFANAEMLDNVIAPACPSNEFTTVSVIPNPEIVFGLFLMLAQLGGGALIGMV